MDTITAAKQIGECLGVLVNAGITPVMEATQALLFATPVGNTPERHAALGAFRAATTTTGDSE